MRLFSFLVCLFCMLVRARPSLKPAVILVPGAFHGPRAFDKVVGRLASAGYHFVDAVALPSAGQLVGRQADVDAVKDVLYRHLDSGRDVVVVGNSYGCTVIGEAVKGAEHRRGRIVSLVYLAGFIPTIKEVEQPETKADIHGLSPIFNFHDDTGKVTPDGDLANHPPQKAFYNLLPRHEAEYWTRQLTFSSFAALNATATYVPYTGDFSVVYVVGSQDRAIPVALTQAWIDQPRAQFTVEHLDADHVPMLSKPEEVFRLIAKYSSIRYWPRDLERVGAGLKAV